jgi:hypothetical protein
MSCLSLVDRLSVGVIVHTLSLLPARLIQVKNSSSYSACTRVRRSAPR